MSAKYKSPSFLLPNELNTDTNPSLSKDGSMYSWSLVVFFCFIYRFRCNYSARRFN